MVAPSRITGRIDTVFQPVVELASGRVFGYEALGRVVGQDGMPVSTPELLARAYAEGWLLALDRAFRRRALERIAERPRDPSLRWFLNVDSRVADDLDFAPGFTHRTLDELGLSDLRVVIELGEHDANLDGARLQRLYPSYARQGFSIALDDFGAGHASLGCLVDVRPEIVKLDGWIVRGVASDPLRLAMVRAMTSFAKEAGIMLVAEGLERPDDLAAVTAAGVPLGQGYLLGRPAALPIESRDALEPEVAA